MRGYLQHLLAQRYTVASAADGVAALEFARREPPDLILADVMMPGLDGFELLRALRDDARLTHVPVILLTARAGEEATVAGIEAGAYDYLVKPFNAQELLARVETQIRRKQSEERFRSYFELGLIGMAITSPDKGVLEVNDEICKILGYEREELLHTTWAELTHPDDLAADVATVERVVNGEIDGYSMDKRWIRKDGTIVHTTISVKCVRRADGTVDRFVALLQDITERMRVHEELERRVAERTQQLTAVQSALATELAALNRLHELSTRSLSPDTKLQPLLDDLLDATMALLNADVGNIQLYNPQTHALEIVAQRGFGQEFPDHGNQVHEGTASCGTALSRKARVIVEDVETGPDCAPHRHVVARAGCRSVQSTPLFGRTGKPLGMISTHFRDRHRPSDDELRMADLYAREVAELIEHKQREAALLDDQKELQELTTRLIDAQELQGKHLARELHDVVSQQLAVVGMEIARLAREPFDSIGARNAGLMRLTERVEKLSMDIHDMSRQIHPAILDDLGLPAAIRSECLAFSSQYGIPADCVIEEIQPDIPEDVGLCLYRVAQESLRNIGKHAGASEVRMTLRSTAGQIVLGVDDSGCGFDPDRAKRKRGLGLVSMDERLRMVGGTLAIRSRPGEGTHVEARVPLRHEPPDA
jgi:PAS domain S-box-containing protein